MGDCQIRICANRIMKRRFVAYWWFTGGLNISLGITVNLTLPNVEIHLPLGFVRIGWSTTENKPFWHMSHIDLWSGNQAIGERIAGVGYHDS